MGFIDDIHVFIVKGYNQLGDSVVIELKTQVYDISESDTKDMARYRVHMIG